MHLNQNIPAEKENQWTAFLNGEPGLSDISDQEEAGMDELTAAWEASGNSFSYSNANTDQAWLNIQKEISKPDNSLYYRISKSSFLKYAAMLVMVVGIGFATYHYMKSPENKLDLPVSMVIAETEAHPVSLTVITLPDGSIVKLNAGTRVEYPGHFAANIRKVKLSGEAFFEVKRDTACPFFIETQNASVEVLGTSFNVSAYPHVGLVQVNVETGKVKLTHLTGNKAEQKSVFLPAGERGWLNVENNQIGQVKISSSNYSSWITKKIVFQRTPLAEAFSVLENTYHVNIKMENPEIGRIPYTANFADLKLEYIVKVIAKTHQLKVKRSGDEIIFSQIKN